MTRVGHWKHDTCDVYVGRGSIWGNPYVPLGWAKRSKHDVVEAADPLAAYEAHVRARPELVRRLPSLAGRVLGCFCVRLDEPEEPARCHGHVLARMADDAAYARDERIAICVASGVDERRAAAIADCEARGGPCVCGAGHSGGASRRRDPALNVDGDTAPAKQRPRGARTPGAEASRKGADR